ncbi:DUF805 domain-containing protein [Hyphobacterium marinum]|uniref:DUF805 domain-containing protein n=1 Tax=Hyphobacterium marinum TaxID=3116574 RepID=A0ABU7M098_9PROT|nr:DUF805 domain-containing protein [Hyphobacterium sp. Y6023]MEE2567239.1 DUF805 domain-containing protein [Hyphobacterium sp. Y6023]
MNIGNVLFSPNGRIGQQDYWVGILIIIVGNIVGGMIPFLGLIITLGLIYVGVCVYGKRLHDIGKTAWIHGIVWLIQFGLGIVAFVMAGGAVMAALSAGGTEEAGVAAAIAASGSLFLIGGLGFLIWIVYTIWLGVSVGEAGANRFGPPPGAAEPAPAAPAQPSQPAPPQDDNNPTISS